MNQNGLQYIILLCLVSIPSLINAQSVAAYVDSANRAYYQKDYWRSALYYDSVVAEKPKDPIHFYNASCSHSLAGNKQKAIEYLKMSLQNGNNNFSWISYDSDLDPIRHMDEYRNLLKEYKSDSVLYIDDLIKLLIENENVTVSNKTISLVPVDFFDKRSYLQSLGEIEGVKLKDSLIDFSTKSLRFFNCTFLNSRAEALGFLNLKRLIIGQCRAEDFSLALVGLKLDDIIIHDNEFTQLTLDGINSQGVFQIWHNEFKYLDITKSLFNIESREDDGFSPYINALNYYPIGIHIHTPGVNSLNIKKSKFINQSTNNTVFGFTVAANSIDIISSVFEFKMLFIGKISDKLNFSNNKFTNQLDFTEFIFPEYNVYMPFKQFEANMIRIISPEEGTYFIYGDSTQHFKDPEIKDRIIGIYKTLYNNYRTRGELESANASYVKLKETELTYLSLKPQKTIEESIHLWLNRVMGVYTDYGTNPGKALIISFYIIILFSVFYFFFPSEWDKESKLSLLKDYRKFIKKNEHGYIKPLGNVLKGFTLSYLNAFTLSANSFVTLGFGTIPTTGLARYVCVLQGLLGWFLLSLFTVALINEVLL